jgi:TetR/AcrR family transcriptional repressor of mexJK operon
MTSETTSKVLREGSATKRAAILRAARDLFLADGFERTSVDAVAARAAVSKRTVYDYFGDKRALLLAVVEQGARSLMDDIQLAIDENLIEVTDLEAAMIAFANHIATSTIGSSDYSMLIRLITTESAQLPALSDHWLSNAPEDAIAERLAQFDRDGLLRVPNPRVAADHFNALTFLLALNSLRRPGGPLHEPNDDGPRIQQVIVDGVRAFLRAYAP